MNQVKGGDGIGGVPFHLISRCKFVCFTFSVSCHRWFTLHPGSHLHSHIHPLVPRLPPPQVLYNALNLGSDVCSMPDFRRLLGTNIAVADNGVAWHAENTVAKLVCARSGVGV